MDENLKQKINNMKIELKKISFYERLSQETNAFNADIYVNDKKAGTAENSGTGGPTNTRFTDRELEKQVEEYCKTLPPATYPGIEGSFPMDLEMYIDDLLTNYLIAKDIAKAERAAIKMMEKSIIVGTDFTNYIPYTFKLTVSISKLSSTPAAHEYLKKMILQVKAIFKNKIADARILNTNIPDSIKELFVDTVAA